MSIIKKIESSFCNLTGRVGYILISERKLENPEHEWLSPVFSYFFPKSIERVVYKHSPDGPVFLKMVGYSKYFDKLQEGSDVPEYVVEFRDNIIDISIVSIKQSYKYKEFIPLHPNENKTLNSN